MASPVRTRDNGAKKLVKSAAGLGKLSLAVGIVGDAGEKSEGGVTLNEIGSFHEFGEGNNPERSFIRAWFDSEKSALESDIRKITKQVLSGRVDERTGLNILGAKFAGQVQKRISNGIAPPLLDETVIRKLANGTGASTPLVATGRLRGSMSWLVE